VVSSLRADFPTVVLYNTLLGLSCSPFGGSPFQAIDNQL
ncbi:hypothetical protein A2U01_0110921, partial [Trifolium medium]|nr:hypothetical protein [Trifolium medium]